MPGPPIGRTTPRPSAVSLLKGCIGLFGGCIGLFGRNPGSSQAARLGVGAERDHSTRTRKVSFCGRGDLPEVGDGLVPASRTGRGRQVQEGAQRAHTPRPPLRKRHPVRLHDLPVQRRLLPVRGAARRRPARRRDATRMPDAECVCEDVAPPVRAAALPTLDEWRDMSGDAITSLEARARGVHAQCTLASVRNLRRNPDYSVRRLSERCIGAEYVDDIRYPDWPALILPVLRVCCGRARWSRGYRYAR